MDDSKPFSSIGALSKATGCKAETIRYYERIGLLPSPPRTEGGHRAYNVGHLKRLNFVRRSRQLGFTLNDVRQMLRLVDDGNVTCEQVRQIATEHLRDIQDKMADLKQMEAALTDTAARCGGGESPDCPIIESLFSGR